MNVLESTFEIVTLKSDTFTMCCSFVHHCVQWHCVLWHCVLWHCVLWHCVLAHTQCVHCHCVHCQRVRFDVTGVANRALDAMVDRSKKRTAFGRPLFKHGTIIKDIADSRIELEMGRLLVLHAARVVDQLGGKNARREVTMIKVAIPNITLKIIDRAIQVRE